MKTKLAYAAVLCLAIGAACGVFLASAWAHDWDYKNADIAATAVTLVTTFYVGLVYLQLEEMSGQRKLGEEVLHLQKDELTRRSSELSITDGVYKDDVDRCGAVVNSGPAPAQDCVPILRQVFKLREGASPQSQLPSDWRPLQRPPAAIGWADRLNPGSSQQHTTTTSNALNTEPKDLIPHCPYYFRLVTLRLVNVSPPHLLLDINTMQPSPDLPISDKNDLFNTQPAGDYRFHVEASSSNGAHAERTYLIHLDPKRTNADALAITPLPTAADTAARPAAS